MKLLTVELENGSVWAIPAHIIADDRAKYYAEKDSDVTYQEEYDYTMDDYYEIIDWGTNNMNLWELSEWVQISIPEKKPFKDRLREALHGDEIHVIDAQDDFPGD